MQCLHKLRELCLSYFICIPWDMCVVQIITFKSLSLSQIVAWAYNPRYPVNWRKKLASSGVRLLYVKLKMETLHKRQFKSKTTNAPLPSLASP